MRRLPLFWLSIALLLGVLVSAYLDLFSVFWSYLAVVSLVCLVAEWVARKRIKSTLNKTKWLPVPISLLFLMFFLGGWRYQANLPHFSEKDLGYYNDLGLITVEGVVVADPQNLERSKRLVVQAAFIHTPQGEMIPVQGKMLTQFRMGDFSYGDRLLLTGALETPPENDEFSYKDYLARSRVYSVMAFPRFKVLAKNQANPFKQGLYSARQFVHLKDPAIFTSAGSRLIIRYFIGDRNRHST